MWIVIGHFYPTITLFSSYLVLPIVFLFTAFFIKYRTSGYFVVPFCFSLILIHDWLFRIYSGGEHDDLGRAWCESMFYSTWKYTSISLVITMLKCSYDLKRLSLSKNKKMNIYFKGLILCIPNIYINLLFFYKNKCSYLIGDNLIIIKGIN